MRAYDHSKNEYRDFVLSRVTDVGLIKEGLSFVGPERDSAWNQFRNLRIRNKINPLDKNELKGIRLDFDLDVDGKRMITKRQAVINYLIDDIKDGFESPVFIESVKKL